MRVCDQFTDERMTRFFTPLNHEVEVHSSVNLEGTPQAEVLGIERVVARIGIDGQQTSVQNPRTGLHDNIKLGQTEKILDLISYPNEVDGSPVGTPRGRFDERQLEILNESDEAAIGLSSLEYAIISLDHIGFPYSAEKHLEGTPFEGFQTAVLPIEEPIPYLDESLEGNRSFQVQAFISKAGNFVSWAENNGTMGANWLVDICVANAYTANRMEHAMVRQAIGQEYVLTGLVATNEPTRAYLEHFDSEFNHNTRAHRGMTYMPHNEPAALGNEKRFPSLTNKEIRHLEKLRDASYRAMVTSRDYLK